MSRCLSGPGTLQRDVVVDELGPAQMGEDAVARRQQHARLPFLAAHILQLGRAVIDGDLGHTHGASPCSVKQGLCAILAGGGATRQPAEARQLPATKLKRTFVLVGERTKVPVVEMGSVLCDGSTEPSLSEPRIGSVHGSVMRFAGLRC